MMLRLVILTASVALCVNASCYFGGLSWDVKTGNSYCKLDDTERLELGEQRVTSSCFMCSCSSSGLSCCGVGIKAGSITVPEGYRIVTDPPCDFHFEPI